MNLNVGTTRSTASAFVAPSNGQRSGYESLFCLGDAIKSNALSVALDAVGLIPEAEGFTKVFENTAGYQLARAVVNNAGYRGVVATQYGMMAVSQGKGGVAMINGALGLGDTSVDGRISTGATLVGFIPGLGTGAAAVSLGVDAYKINKAQSACVDSGKYNRERGTVSTAPKCGRVQNLKDGEAMSLTRDVRMDIKAAKKLRMPEWAVVCVIIASFLCAWLFDNFGKLELVLPILNSILVLGFMLVLKRKLWRYAWFWGAMAVIAALHVPLILSFPWTTRWFPALAIALIDSVDFCLILWILAVVEKFRGEQTTAESGDRSL